MKLQWLVIAGLFAFDLYAAVPRNASVTKQLVISADINIAAKVAPGIAVTLMEQQVRLNWDSVGKSFVDRRFAYHVYLDSTAAEATTRYSIGVRDINLNCATKGGNYHYSGIDPSRAGGFDKPVVRWSNGTQATIGSVGQAGDVKSPASTMSMLYSTEFGRDVPSAHGSISFRFPLLTREVVDGGADCTGGAILMFYGEL
ncbi:hypothetical protein [Aeromonas sp. SG16]|uniref:hypothetical protein n=1 Tax=Aeromonas sp. SG16 TaxID=2950548 RepID=UPI0021093B85|nr:hypothetical protein [Aeromonas sp. SG16]MCQ4054430.1 hypothetical protein [Aeromonas sp. SG16]